MCSRCVTRHFPGYKIYLLINILYSPTQRPEPHVLAARKETAVEALSDEGLDFSTPQAMGGLPTSFAHPGLLPAFTQSMTDILGADAKSTPIQALALKHLVPLTHPAAAADRGAGAWRQALLASETGCGKSFAYLFPLLQHLKETEHTNATTTTSSLAITPRALVLAPTHELSCQLAAFAKGLIHHAKLRVLCASRANVLNRSGVRAGGGTARQMKRVVDALVQSETDRSGTGNLGLEQRLVDVLVSTPVKALEMVRGWGWDKSKDGFDKDGKPFVPGKIEMGLEHVECVVVDEADLRCVSHFLRYKNIYSQLNQTPTSNPKHSTSSQTSAPPGVTLSPLQLSPYPFHFLLTPTTIPVSLFSHLTTYYPSCTRLASPNLHRLLANLHTEHVPFADCTGTRGAAIAARLKRIWAEDALRRQAVPIFANRRGAAATLASDPEARGIPYVALVSGSAARAISSNKHLAGLLKHIPESAVSASTSFKNTFKNSEKDRDAEKAPRVLITTSLPSSALDFAPDVLHVFPVD